jgi:hypothetical protein
MPNVCNRQSWHKNQLSQFVKAELDFPMSHDAQAQAVNDIIIVLKNGILSASGKDEKRQNIFTSKSLVIIMGL